MDSDANISSEPVQGAEAQVWADDPFSTWRRFGADETTLVERAPRKPALELADAVGDDDDTDTISELAWPTPRRTRIARAELAQAASSSTTADPNPVPERRWSAVWLVVLPLLAFCVGFFVAWVRLGSQAPEPASVCDQTQPAARCAELAASAQMGSSVGDAAAGVVRAEDLPVLSTSDKNRARRSSKSASSVPRALPAPR